MNALTITRDFGAGGYETARALAEMLGWELLDRELLHKAAEVEHVPDAELERLDEKAVSLADRFRLHPPHQRYLHGLREAALQAAVRGKVVLVGRGAGHLLSDTPNVLHVRLVAAKEWRARRMMAREGWTWEHALARCTEEDRVRTKYTRYFFGDEPFQAARYHLTFNTGQVPLDDVIAATAALLQNDWSVSSAPASRAGRVMTLTSELGTDGTGFAAALAAKLGLRVYDHELLKQEVTRLGVHESELEKIDEQPAGIFERFWPGSLYQRYFGAMERIMNELAVGGDALLVGRGGQRFLRDHPSAFHVRLIAPMQARVRQVMEQRWVSEAPARKLIADSDARRRRFLESYFGADWSDPLEYHVTVNSGLLGPSAVDLTAFSAERYWVRTEMKAGGAN